MSVHKLRDPFREMGSPKRSQGGEGSDQKITEDHNHRGGRAKELAKLKLQKVEIIICRISYQLVVQEVIFSYLIRMSLTKRCKFWKVV